MEAPLIPKTQTIVVSQERCKVFKEEIDKVEFFAPTEIDNHISDFVESVIDAGGMVTGVSTLAGNENIIAVISWYDEESTKKIQGVIDSRIARPNPNGGNLKLV
jgi:CTP:phosphocholine cytidylyltransferase-like protein